jgi:hypothetical protein
MLSKLKSVLIGTLLPTQQLAEKRLNKNRALATFSPDALSSIAYANQEIYLRLVAAAALLLDHLLDLAVSPTAGYAQESIEITKEKPL